ncbi:MULTISPECIES: DUF308 domain-containing protein [unclassified Streptomyces]|jgi:uncharacterized membrane protein HdeD (DUF308 family)|uniref:HdeD family acid-resistance protein n=1 Tax=unclassified Streptomyces TaxID=2593676 RepID=UPI000FFF4390|nr:MULTISPECIES: DUF308 domain-containing protein [unclassified Streptomyces]
MTIPRGPASRTGPEHSPDGVAPGQAGGAARALEQLGRSWTWVLASSVMTLVPGVLVLVWPDETLHVLAVLIGLYLLVTGAFRFVAVFAGAGGAERVVSLAMSILFVLGGVLCLRNPLQTIAALSLIVGLTWLMTGILTLYTAIAAEDMPHRGFVVGAAVIGIVAGIVVLAMPSESARALTRLLGLWLVLLGLAELVLALAWRAALRRVGLTGRTGASAADGATSPG